MKELSPEALEGIAKLLADVRALNSDCINLHNYAPRRSKLNSYDSPLNDIYHFLIDNGFITSNNPTSDVDRFLSKFTSKGRSLHKSGSLLRYCNKDIPNERQILDYLVSKREPENNRLIQQALGTDEVEFENKMRFLYSKGYTYYEEICEGNYMDCGFSSISPEGRNYLDDLKNPKRNHFSTIPTISGNGNVVTVAGGNVHQSNISINISTNFNYDSLKELGIGDTEINELKKINVNQTKDKSTHTLAIMKWLGTTAKEVATKGLVDNLPRLIETIGDLIK